MESFEAARENLGRDRWAKYLKEARAVRRSIGLVDQSRHRDDGVPADIELSADKGDESVRSMNTITMKEEKDYLDEARGAALLAAALCADTARQLNTTVTIEALLKTEKYLRRFAQVAMLAATENDNIILKAHTSTDPPMHTHRPSGAFATHLKQRTTTPTL